MRLKVSVYPRKLKKYKVGVMSRLILLLELLKFMSWYSNILRKKTTVMLLNTKLRKRYGTRWENVGKWWVPYQIETTMTGRVRSSRDREVSLSFHSNSHSHPWDMHQIDCYEIPHPYRVAVCACSANRRSRYWGVGGRGAVLIENFEPRALDSFDPWSLIYSTQFSSFSQP